MTHTYCLIPALSLVRVRFMVLAAALTHTRDLVPAYTVVRVNIMVLTPTMTHAYELVPADHCGSCFVRGSHA